VAWGGASVEEMSRVVDALYRVHHLVAVITDLDTLLERVLEQSKAVAQAEGSSLMLYDPVQEDLYFRVVVGEQENTQVLMREVRLNLDQGIAGAAATTRETVNVADVEADPRFFRGADEASKFKTRSILAVPLLERDNLVGVLEVVNKVGGGPFSGLDQRVLEMFSGIVAASITNARLIEENIRAERMAGIGEAVAGLSHYTKNIISGMVASAELIEEGLEGSNLEMVARCWPVLNRATKRISIFVEDMLSFSKPRKPFLEPCDVPALIDEVAQNFDALFTRKNVALILETNELQDARPLLDGAAIFRCVLNLVTNAGDAVPPEGGEIRIVACRREDEELEIRVEDNGDGVPEDMLAKIFEPFYSTKGSRGTGLGLAVTRKIILEHGGTIEVDSCASGGARFRILLPFRVAKGERGYG